MDAPFYESALWILPEIPIILIAVIGIALAWRGRPAHPVSARLVSIGLALLFVHAIVDALMHRSHAHFDRYDDAAVYAQHLAWLRFAVYALNIAGVAFITSAVFAKRNL